MGYLLLSEHQHLRPVSLFVPIRDPYFRFLKYCMLLFWLFCPFEVIQNFLIIKTARTINELSLFKRDFHVIPPTSYVTLSNPFFITGRKTYEPCVSRAVKPLLARHTSALSRDLALIFSYPVRVGAAHRPRGIPARKSPSPKWDHAPKWSRPAARTPLHRSAWAVRRRARSRCWYFAATAAKGML